MPGDFDESKHPRANDGKFGAGGGAAKTAPTTKAKPTKGNPKGKATNPAAAPVGTKPPKAESKAKAATQKIAAARAVAKTKAAAVVAKAKERAKALTGGVKAKADAAKAKAAASGKKISPAVKARIAKARVAAKEKAAAIVAKAKERAKAIKAKVPAKAQPKVKPVAPAIVPTQSTKPPAPAPNPTKVQNPASTAVHSLVAGDRDRARFASDVSVNVTDKTGTLFHSQFSAGGQAAMRSHTDNLLNAYGMHNRDAGLVSGKLLQVRTAEGMAGALGLHWGHDGRIALASGEAAGLRKHSQLDGAGLKAMGQQALADIHNGVAHENSDARQQLSAYHTMVHEAIHGHGPDMIRTSPFVFVEEVMTEMAARKIVGDVHGVPAEQMSGSYGKWITPAITKLMEHSGASYATAHSALADVSIIAKRSPNVGVSPTDMLHWMGTAALIKLGVKDSDAHNDFYDSMYRLALRE